MQILTFGFCIISSILNFSLLRIYFHPIHISGKLSAIYFQIKTHMKKSIQEFWQANTLVSIILLALILRLLAAIFAKGFSMNDDHFVVIHVAQRWIDGYNDWFNMDHPSGFSLVYTGLHYLLFYLLKSISITDPVVKMYIVRIIHAVYSLLTVYFGYKIAEQISNKKIARNVGLLFSCLLADAVYECA